MTLTAYKPNEDIFSGHQNIVIGITGAGKNVFTETRLKQIKRPILYFDPQYKKKLRGFTHVSGKYETHQIISALKSGAKLHYEPSKDDILASCELAVLTDALINAGFTEKENMIFVINELPALCDHKEGKRASRKIANRGRVDGVHSVVLVQRPAEVPRASMAQAKRMFIFETNTDAKYFKEKGINQNQVEDLLTKGGQYSYVVYEKKNITGPYKE